MKVKLEKVEKERNELRLNTDRSIGEQGESLCLWQCMLGQQCLNVLVDLDPEYKTVVPTALSLFKNTISK